MNRSNDPSYKKCRMRSGIIFLFALFTAQLAICQMPNTSAYSFSFKKNDVGNIEIRNAKYLSAFNKEGYNNQPSFVKKNEIYMSCRLPGEEQTEVYSLDLYARKLKKITETPDSEYSPTLMPNKTHFSCVRVENDGNETQRLWKFPIDRSNNGEAILDNVAGVGYHCWLSQSKVALFIVGEPHRLVLANIQEQTVTELTSKIGRGMQKMKNGNLAYIQKLGESTWYIKELDAISYRSSIIIETLKGAEDFIILDDQTFLMASDSKIYSFKKGKDSTWQELADLRPFGISNITRLAFNGDATLIVIAKN